MAERTAAMHPKQMPKAFQVSFANLRLYNTNAAKLANTNRAKFIYEGHCGRSKIRRTFAERLLMLSKMKGWEHGLCKTSQEFDSGRRTSANCPVSGGIARSAIRNGPLGYFAGNPKFELSQTAGTRPGLTDPSRMSSTSMSKRT